MTTPQPLAPSFALSTRILAASLMGALVVMGVALSFVLPPAGSLPVLVPVAQVAAGVVVHLLLDAVGYRLPALPTHLTDEEAVAQGRTRWQTGMILRFAIAEFIAIASIAAAFVLTDGDVLVYLGGALVSLVLMGIHVWPWARPVGRTADVLESGGKPSGLRETFGLTSPGPIQQL